jgi:hypothetical protein
MYKTYKAKYLGSGVWSINDGEKKFFYTIGYIRLTPNQEYYILVDNEDLILSIVPV